MVHGDLILMDSVKVFISIYLHIVCIVDRNTSNLVLLMNLYPFILLSRRCVAACIRWRRVHSSWTSLPEWWLPRGVYRKPFTNNDFCNVTDKGSVNQRRASTGAILRKESRKVHPNGMPSVPHMRSVRDTASPSSDLAGYAEKGSWDTQRGTY